VTAKAFFDILFVKEGPRQLPGGHRSKNSDCLLECWAIWGDD